MAEELIGLIIYLAYSAFFFIHLCIFHLKKKTFTLKVKNKLDEVDKIY